MFFLYYIFSKINTTHLKENVSTFTHWRGVKILCHNACWITHVTTITRYTLKFRTSANFSVENKNKTGSRNHKCCKKWMSITNPLSLSLSLSVCVCVCVAWLIQHEKRTRHIILSSVAVRLYRIFPHYLINCTIFGKKLLKIKRVFWFSLHFLSETFLILRITKRVIITNVKTFSCKVPFILVKF
jgi:hypothetical protein